MSIDPGTHSLRNDHPSLDETDVWTRPDDSPHPADDGPARDASPIGVTEPPTRSWQRQVVAGRPHVRPADVVDRWILGIVAALMMISFAAGALLVARNSDEPRVSPGSTPQAVEVSPATGSPP